MGTDRPSNKITVCSHECWSLANHLLQQKTTISWIHEEVSQLAIVLEAKKDYRASVHLYSLYKNMQQASIRPFLLKFIPKLAARSLQILKTPPVTLCIILLFYYPFLAKFIKFKRFFLLYYYLLLTFNRLFVNVKVWITLPKSRLLSFRQGFVNILRLKKQR